jgi:dipeptidyl aminopeptidase/acylaminoacyl peptidase
MNQILRARSVLSAVVKSSPVVALVLLLAALYASALARAGQTQNDLKRAPTVADAIRMTRWADRDYVSGGPPGPVGLFSPNAEHFVVVMKKGDLDSNTNNYSLLLFESKDVFSHPHPRVLVRMSSTSNRDAITAVRWLNDNESITFLGENRAETAQVYRFNIRTNRLERLTRHRTAIVAYDVSEDGGEVLYEADPPAAKILATEQTRRNGVVIVSQYPTDLLTGDSGVLPKATQGYKELYAKAGDGAASRIPVADFVLESLPFSLSPNGRYAVLPVYLAHVSVSWLQFQDQLLKPFMAARPRAGIPFNVQQYLLVDIRTKHVSPLLDAPMSWQNRGMAWGKQSHSIVLSGVYLPLGVDDAAERETREKQPFVAEIAVPSKQITKVTSEMDRVVRWDRQTDMVVLEPGNAADGAGPRVYRKTDGIWARFQNAPNDASNSHALKIALEEDMNTPPRIFASDESTHREVMLFDLNPQYREIGFAREQAITWKASDGHSVSGGVYLPQNFSAGVRYPLVIQTHGFDESRFWIDGPWTSVFAAQPLAASGFVVLQVGRSTNPSEDRRFLNTPAEAARQMAAYEGAIDYLDSRGLIDKSRVGIIGFSRTVYHVSYALTHSKYRFEAAVLADGFDAGYVNSLLWWDPNSYSSVIGGPPSGETMSLWLQNSPGFNLEKISGAVRLEYYGTTAPLAAWQLFGGLSNMGKPVDFIWLPFGTHLLVKPWERYTSLQGTVDWFRFWLQGQENPSPRDKAQNERWENLRTERH